MRGGGQRLETHERARPGGAHGAQHLTGSSTHLKLLADFQVENGINELRGEGQAAHKGGQRALHRLSVGELDAHGHALLLQRLNLAADVAEVGLERAEHVLHALQNVVARRNLCVQLRQPAGLLVWAGWGWGGG